MTNVEFVSWLDDHVKENKKLPQCKRRGNEVELNEIDQNVNMTVLVEGVPESVVVISPQKVGQWELFPVHKPKWWRKRCDFLFVGKVEEGYCAIFVELKRTIDERDRDGNRQLRWSQPILHYLLSVFNVHTCTGMDKSEINIRHWIIGQRPAKQHARHQLNLGDEEVVCFDTEYKGLMIRNKVAPLISFRELLEP